MIPARIDADTENHYFLRDERAGFHLVFVSREAKKQNPFMPHWVAPCGNKESLDAMCRWTSVRRDQWEVWGELAERIGHRAFAKHMDDLLKAEPLVRVEAALLQRQDDPVQVGIGEMLTGPEGMRLEVLHVHTFQSVEACEAFHGWFHTGRNHEAAGALLNIAYSAGTDELGDVMDRIAADFLAKPKRAPRGRRRGGSNGRQRKLAA